MHVLMSGTKGLATLAPRKTFIFAVEGIREGGREGCKRRETRRGKKEERGERMEEEEEEDEEDQDKVGRGEWEERRYPVSPPSSPSSSPQAKHSHRRLIYVTWVICPVSSLLSPASPPPVPCRPAPSPPPPTPLRGGP